MKMMDRIPHRKAWAGWTKGVSFGALMLFMTACAGAGDLNITHKLADRVTPVATEYRAVRVCLMAAGIVEVMTDRIQMYDGAAAPEAIGRLMALQGAVDTARRAGADPNGGKPMWFNTDMTDVSIQFARVLKDAGKEKLGRILMGGPTILNALNIVGRAMLLTAKGEAVLLDINRMLAGLGAEIYTEQEIWTACEGRIATNRRVLSILSGIPTQ